MAPELAKADILVGNDEEFAMLCCGSKNEGLSLAHDLAGKGQLVLYKMGEKGCRSFYQGNEMKTGIFPVAVAKPFGAGDAFLGNFIIKLAQNADIEAAVFQGSAVSGICCCSTWVCVCNARYPATPAIC